jgi:uncharacterized protein (DUF305 family)
MNYVIPFVRKCLVLATLLVGQISFAQNTPMNSRMPIRMSMPMNQSNPQGRKNIYLVIMDSMMVQMDKATNRRSMEADFVSQMIPHHEGAVAMATYEIQHGRNFGMVQLAKSILTEQRSEIQLMSIWLMTTSANETELRMAFQNELDKTMTTMMEQLPSAERLSDIDRAFALVMIPHHQAAIDMARVMLKHAGEQQAIAFARQLISNEQIEIEQMTSYLN